LYSMCIKGSANSLRLSVAQAVKRLAGRVVGNLGSPPASSACSTGRHLTTGGSLASWELAQGGKRFPRLLHRKVTSCGVSVPRPGGHRW